MVTVELIYDMYVLSVTVDAEEVEDNDEDVDDSDLISMAVDQAVGDWGRAAGDFDHARVI